MKKEHWERIYREKQPHEVSWTQKIPGHSLRILEELSIPLDAPVIDVGGGDSRFVDHLVAKGYRDITVLDISGAALKRAQARLGKDAVRVRWVESDVLDFTSDRQFTFWHDRAVFHFFTEAADIRKYADMTAELVYGYMSVGTFSENGPRKCSGLDITQYSEASMEAVFSGGFSKRDCVTEDHRTPFDTVQNFIFCTFESFPKNQ